GERPEGRRRDAQGAPHPAERPAREGPRGGRRRDQEDREEARAERAEEGAGAQEGAVRRVGLTRPHSGPTPADTSRDSPVGRDRIRNTSPSFRRVFGRSCVQLRRESGLTARAGTPAGGPLASFFDGPARS